jgi:ribosomal protein S11
MWDLSYLVKYLRVKVKFKGNLNINLIVGSAVNSARISTLYNLLLKSGFIVSFVKIADKIPHNGCRLKKKTTKLRKRTYLG